MATELYALRKSMCLGLSAATGGLLAVLSDIAQKQDASAVEHLQSALTGVLGLRTYPAVVVLALIVLAVALSFIFQVVGDRREPGHHDDGRALQCPTESERDSNREKRRGARQFPLVGPVDNPRASVRAERASE